MPIVYTLAKIFRDGLQLPFRPPEPLKLPRRAVFCPTGRAIGGPERVAGRQPNPVLRDLDCDKTSQTLNLLRAGHAGVFASKRKFWRRYRGTCRAMSLASGVTWRRIRMVRVPALHDGTIDRLSVLWIHGDGAVVSCTSLA